MDIIFEKNRILNDEFIHVNKVGYRTGLAITNPEGKGNEQQPPAPSTRAASPPPSSSTSPSHEFSFTISINPSSSTQRTPQASSSSSSFAVMDLSPADDIFFHGHLLPLHLLSHLPLSPRSSTNSSDNLTLPIHNLNQNKTIINHHRENNITNTSSQNPYQKHDQETKTRTKSKSFSLFGLPKRQKGCESIVKDHHQKDNKTTITTKLKFEVLKRYLRMVRPLLSSFKNNINNRRENKMQQHFHRQAYSFSGNTSFRDDDDEKLIRGKRIQFSAPASIRTSPNNSGPLTVGNNNNFHSCSSSSDSTMEELQAAIQAAIAHCKNSISMEDKKKTLL